MTYRVLFVDRDGKSLAPAAAEWLNAYCAERGIDAKIIAAGVAVWRGKPGQDAPTPVTRQLCETAGVVAYTEPGMEERLRIATGGLATRLLLVGLPDSFNPDFQDGPALENVSSAEMRSLFSTYWNHRYGKRALAKVLEAYVTELLPERVRSPVKRSEGQLTP